MEQKPPIPKSRAKNAYDLLTDVRLIILEEPQRYDQRQWKPRPGKVTSLAPARGTVGCVAGWVDTLKARRPVAPGDNWNAAAVGASARKILGLSEKVAKTLFSGAAIPGELREGTPEYARAGSRHIAAFQQRHARKLKAKRV